MDRRRMLKTLGVAGTGSLLGAGLAQGQATESAGVGDTSKPAKTVNDLFDRYDRRFAEAMAHMPVRSPVCAEERSAIVGEAKRCLGIRDAWVPSIRAETAGQVKFPGGHIELLRSGSWPGPGPWPW